MSAFLSKVVMKNDCSGQDPDVSLRPVADTPMIENKLQLASMLGE